MNQEESFPLIPFPNEFMRRPRDVLAIGKPKVEQVVKVNEWPDRGAQLSFKIDQLDLTVGGCGASVCSVVGRLGGNAALIARVGEGKYGKKSYEELLNSNVDIQFVKEIKGIDGNLLIILTNAEGDWCGLAHLYEELCPTIEDIPDHKEFTISKFFYIDGFTFALQSEKEAVEEAILRAQYSKTYVCIDGAVPTALEQPDYLRALFKICDVTFANLYESQIITGAEGIEDVIEAYQDLGPSLCVLKLGADGSYAITKESSTYVPAHQIDVVDTVGAGDAYTAAVLLSLARGESLSIATTKGAAAGSLACLGAGSLSMQYNMEDIEKMIRADGR